MKDLTKRNITIITVIAPIVVALILTMAFVLKGCQNDHLNENGNETSQEDKSPLDSSETNPTDTSNSTDTSDTPKPTVTTYTVTFMDHDGKILKTEKVEKGKSATAPDNIKRENFMFAGWDKKFDNVTSDMVITATYTTTKTVIYAEHVSINKSAGEVTMNIRVINNPGIMGAVLKVFVNDDILSFKEANKTEYPGLTLTSPGPQTTASPYTFMLDALELSREDKKDGILFAITFNIKDTAATSKYDVTLSYDTGAIFDEDYNDPMVCLENGSITIQ